MKYIVVMLLCVASNAYRSDNTALPTVKQITTVIKSVNEIAKSLTEFGDYYPLKDIEKHLEKLNEFGRNLSALATSISSLNKIWELRNLKRYEIIEITDSLRSLGTMLKVSEDSWKSAEKALLEKTLTPEQLSQKYDKTSRLKSFGDKVPQSHSDLIGVFDRMIPTSYNSDDDRKRLLKETLDCGKDTISGKAKDFLKLLHSDITYTDSLNADAMFPELYMVLNKSSSRSTDFPKFAKLNMIRAIASSLLFQFCINGASSADAATIVENSGRKAAAMVKEVFVALTDLATALEDSNMSDQVGSLVKRLVSEKWDRVKSEVSSVTDKKEQEIQTHLKFITFAKTLWENLNSSLGRDTNFGVYITQNKDASLHAGEEVVVEQIEPLKVIVHWSPKRRPTDRVMAEYNNLFDNVISKGNECKYDDSAANKWQYYGAGEIKNFIQSLVPLITNNKVPFVLLTNVLVEHYGENAFHNEACFPFDIFIGI